MKIIYIKKENLYMILSGVLILIILLLLALYKNKSKPVYYIPMINKTVGIDPGHGGVDPGAVGITGVREDEINLKIGLKLKRLIEQSGGLVIITRDTKEGLYTEESKTIREMKTEDLENRREIINKSKCNIFLTIHLNSFEQSKYYGAQTFYKKGCKDGMELANCIQDELREVLDKNNHRIPQERDDVYLLNEVNISAVLVECGFLSNPVEEKLLISDKYQEKIAWAIYMGIMKYFSNGEGDYKF
ncbi:MAG: N-acetylmuramoyl-L-alanine amidase CwlD [Tissierellia bacterium]|nr:N-acetylmuramoyl-L-alanine amidase CwlD [Tissierellia bacterium]